MKALVGAFNQEKALVEAFSVIVQPVVEPMELYTALPEIDEPSAFLLPPSTSVSKSRRTWQMLASTLVTL